MRVTIEFDDGTVAVLNEAILRPKFPKCEFKWKDDALVLECQSTGDRDRAKEILEKGDVILKVRKDGMVNST